MTGLVTFVDKVCGGLDRLNSMTKYPSIPTYHPMGDRGRLLAEPIPLPGDDTIQVTEKVDGTNARVIVTPEGAIIGSREELLWAKGDMIGNPSMGIVDAIRRSGMVDHLEFHAMMDRIFVVYVEVAGGKTSKAARCYTRTAEETKLAVFDIAVLTLSQVEVMATEDLQRIASWREAGRDRFVPRGIEFDCDMSIPENVEYTAYMRTEITMDMPRTLSATAQWMADSRWTQEDPIAAMDRDHIEGYVVRTLDSRWIAKLRFEDYRRSLR